LRYRFEECLLNVARSPPRVLFTQSVMVFAHFVVGEIKRRRNRQPWL